MDDVRLKISTLNLHNFYIAPPIQEGESQKADSKVKELAAQIRLLAPDILMVQEVGGIASLERFCSVFLANEYRCKMITGNSNRGIELGYLYRSDFSFEIELLSHKDRILDGAPLGHFSRDVSQLMVKSAGKTILVLLNVHLKSKRSIGEIDPTGDKQRFAELAAALEIFDECEKKYQVPVILGGDFNSSDTPQLIESLDHPFLRDILCYTNSKETWTHVFFDKAKRRHLLQFDYLFISDQWREHIIVDDSGRFADRFAVKIPHLPHQLYQAPTDHFPISLALALEV